MGKIPFTTRFIATILLTAFVAQDIVWADPDALRACGPDRSLQVESSFKPFHLETFFQDSLRKQLKLVLAGILNKIDDFNMVVVRPLEVAQANGSIAKLKYDFEHKYRRGDKWVVPCSVADDSINYKKYFEAEIETDADGSIKFDGSIKLAEIGPGAIIEKKAPVPEIYAGDRGLYEKKIRDFARRDDVTGLAEYLASLDPASYPGQCNDIIDVAIASSYDETKRPCCISHVTTEAIAEACRKNPALIGVFADRIASALDKGHYAGTYTLAEIIVRLSHLSFKYKETENFPELLTAKLPDEAKLVQALRNSFAENFEITHDKLLPALSQNDVSLQDGVVLKEINSNWYLIEHNGAPAGIVEAYDVPGGPAAQLAINVFEPARKAGIGTNIMKWAAGQLKAGDTIVRPYPADESNLKLFLKCRELGILSSVEIVASPADDIHGFYGEEPAWRAVLSVKDADSYRGSGKKIFVRGTVSKIPYTGARPEVKARGIFGAEYIKRLGSDLKLMFEKILDIIDRIRVRNPIVFMQPAGYGPAIPVGLQLPIVMMAVGRPRPNPHAAAPGPNAANQQPPQFISSAAEPEKDDDSDIYPAGVIAKENIAAIIDPITGPADNVNTPEEVMNILKRGSDLTAILDMHTGKEKNVRLSRNWALRYPQLLPDDLKGASPYKLITPLDEALLRERVTNALHLVDMTENSAFSRLFKTVRDLAGTDDIRVYIGSETGYFQVSDTNEKFQHQLDIVFVTQGDQRLTYIKRDDQAAVNAILGPMGKDVVNKVRVRIVGAETLKKAFTQEEWLNDPKRIQERADLQAMFVELYRTYFPATGTSITLEGKVPSANVDKFFEDLKAIEKHYAKRKVEEIAALSKTIEDCKAEKKAFKQEDAQKKLSDELEKLKDDLDDIETAIQRYTEILSPAAVKQLTEEGKKISEDRKLYDKMTNIGKRNYATRVSAYNGKVRLYETAKQKLPPLLKKRDEYLTAIEQVSADIDKIPGDFMKIERKQNNAYRMREYDYQIIEYCIGNEKLIPGTIIHNKYMITGMLGSGGFGVVYSANDLSHTDMDKQVAIKTASPLVMAVYDGYLNEIKHTGNPEFSRAPKPLYMNDKGSYGKHVYFAMSLEKGKTLRSIISAIRAGDIELDMLKRTVLLYILAKLVADFHDITTLIHRDLKPDNFMIHTDPDGNFAIPGMPKDAGSNPRAMKLYLESRDVEALARKSCIIDLGMVVPGKVVVEHGIERIVPEGDDYTAGGTPLYMSPEQGFDDRPNMSDLSDIYSMGIIFYEILTDGCYPMALEPGQDTPKGAAQLILNKKANDVLWPNEAIKRRKINMFDIRRLAKINIDIPGRLVAAKVIVGPDGNPFSWTDGRNNRELADSGCRWNKNLADNEEALRKVLANIRELTNEGRDEIVKIVVKKKVPDPVAALVMQMLRKEPVEKIGEEVVSRPDARMVRDELDKILRADPKDAPMYQTESMKTSKTKKAVLFPIEHPILSAMLITFAVAGFFAGSMLSKRVETRGREEIVAEADKIIEAKLSDQRKKIEAEAAKEGVTDLSGTIEEVYDRMWKKKAEEAEGGLQKLTAEADAAKKAAEEALAGKAKAVEEIVKLDKRAQEMKAEAEKARAETTVAKRLSEEATKEMQALAQKRAELERSVKLAEETVKEALRLQQEIAKRKADIATLDAEYVKMKAALDKANAERRRVYLQIEAAKLGLDTSGTEEELQKRIEKKRSFQPSYIISYIEDGKPNWFMRIAFSLWSVPHEIGNFIQAALTGRIFDLMGMSLKNLFYGWEYKGRAPPCIGGTIVNILIGGILLNYFPASPYSIAYNVINFVFIMIEIAAMIEVIKDALGFHEMRFRDPVIMAETSAGDRIPVGLQWPIVFMQASEAELSSSERPDFVPEVEPEYVRSFLRDFIFSLEHAKLSSNLSIVTTNVTAIFDGIRERTKTGWLEPYLLLDGRSAILVFKNGPNSTGLGSKTIAYKISLKKPDLPALKKIASASYRNAVLQNTYVEPSEYLGSFNTAERISLAARSMDHSSHLNFSDALNFALMTSSIIQGRIKTSLDKEDEVVTAMLQKASNVFFEVAPLCKNVSEVAELHKSHKVLSMARSKVSEEGIRKAFKTLKDLNDEWNKKASVLDRFKKRYPGEITDETDALGRYITALAEMMVTEEGIIEAKPAEPIEKKNGLEVVEGSIGSVQTGPDNKMAVPCRIIAAQESFKKRFALGYDIDIKVKTEALDIVKQYDIAGSWRALAFSVENAIYGAAKASTNTNEPIEIDVKTACRDGQDYIDITVKDRGRGMEPSDIAKISDPDYTTTGGGAGWAFARRAIQDAGGSTAISSKTSGASQGTSVTISWPINKITAEPERVKAAVAKAPATKKTTAPIVKTDVPREKLLRNMNDLDDVGKNMVEGIFSLSLSGKVVLAFDNKLGGAHKGIVLSVFDELEKLKDIEKFKTILKNLQIVILPAEQIASKLENYKKEGCQVFIFASSAEEGKFVTEERIHPTYIDENSSQFPLYDSDVYYPLAEIVTVTLAQYLDPRSIEELGTVLKDMNIRPAVKDGVYTFTLLPPSQRFNLEELKQRYMDLKKVLVSA